MRFNDIFYWLVELLHSGSLVVVAIGVLLLLPSSQLSLLSFKALAFLPSSTDPFPFYWDCLTTNCAT